MKLYLVRHAIAYEHGDPAFANDDDRTLTPEGRKKFQEAARGLLRVIDPPAVILTSPLPRATQTAEILQRAAGAEMRIEHCEALRPEGSFAAIVATCRGLAGDGSEAAARDEVLKRGIALVGHRPAIGELAAYFIGGEGAGFSLPLTKGGAACIEFEPSPEAGAGELEWLLTQRLLRRLS